jgi:hypothetical protein
MGMALLEGHQVTLSTLSYLLSLSSNKNLIGGGEQEDGKAVLTTDRSVLPVADPPGGGEGRANTSPSWIPLVSSNEHRLLRTLPATRIAAPAQGLVGGNHRPESMAPRHPPSDRRYGVALQQGHTGRSGTLGQYAAEGGGGDGSGRSN